jgi:NAD dependent epimerase/dehydratase
VLVTPYWPGKRVLVTGAGGFIGSHLVDRLVSEGAEVRAFVRSNSRGSLGALEWESDLASVEVHPGDLRDPTSVERAAAGCELVLHLGAQVSIPYSYVAPREVVETNVLGTLNVLSAARREDAQRVVCVSTSEVYGTPDSVPISESEPLNAQSPYAASKIGADMLALSFHRAFDLRVGVVRPFNTYGPRQSARAVIPTVLVQALAGDSASLGSLEPVRDFTYVDDTVGGLLAFAEWDGAPGRTVQLGTGRGVSVAEIVELAEEVVGRKIEVRLDERRLRPPTSEVERLVSDPSAAGELLGWEARIPLREGLARTAGWIEANLARYRPHVYEI